MPVWTDQLQPGQKQQALGWELKPQSDENLERIWGCADTAASTLANGKDSFRAATVCLLHIKAEGI